MVRNLAAYRFVTIAEPSAVQARVQALCETLELRGSVLVAHEGINLFLAGAPAAIDDFLKELGDDERFADLPVKFSDSMAVPFRRLRVRIKPEIITFVDRSLDPAAARAPSVSPGQLRDWLRQGHDDAGRELVLLDTRNREEVAHGSFAGAITLPIDTFTALPAAVDACRDDFAGKTVVSFCTGGIRCEKAALWLQQAGIDNVLQLDGGILGYFEQIGGEGYSGGCFVFDERVVLGPDLTPLPSVQQPDVA
jgi:UPF0176 protein